MIDGTDSYSNHSTIICQDCWTHIKDFHEFQQSILLSQCRLTVDVKPLLEVVKEESNNICPESEANKADNGNNNKYESLQEADQRTNQMTILEVAAKESREFQQDFMLMPFDLKEHVERHPDDAKKENLQKLSSSSDSDIKDDGDSIGMKDDMEDYDQHSSSDDLPISQIISTKEVTKSMSKLKRTNRKTRNNKQCVTKSSSERKTKSKRFPNDDDKSSKEIAHNSAEKIQELDNFIAEVKPHLECDLCKRNYPNYNSLRSHFTDVHQMKCFVVCCDKKIFRRYLLVEHLRLHVNPETFKCDICGAISASSRTLIAHKRFMHNTAKTLECEVCHRKFKGKPTLIRHMATHATGSKDFKCGQCDRCFAFEFQLKLHVNNVHSEVKICDQCGKSVHGAASLKQHLLQHSGNKQTKWPCDQCDAQLASLWGLKSHKLSFHPDGKTAFICKECGKVASSETTLKRHKRLVHQMERKYKCTYCEKAFKKNSHLKDHIATHTGQHIHQCSLCSQTFINSGSLHKHRKKAHPVEWTESRLHRIDLPKVNADSVVREVLL